MIGLPTNAIVFSIIGRASPQASMFYININGIDGAAWYGHQNLIDILFELIPFVYFLSLYWVTRYYQVLVSGQLT
jgi:hypothetical protein